jgi:hypothetical protein
MAGSDAANFDFKVCPELAAREYRISLKSKLPHLASILDGHFVAGYRIWEGLGRIGSRWFWRPSNFKSRWFLRPSRFDFRCPCPQSFRFDIRWSNIESCQKSSLDSISGHLKLKLDGTAVPSKIKVRWHLDSILDALISSRFDFKCPNIESCQNYC